MPAGSTSLLLPLVQQLVELTEAAVVCALRFDSDSLAELNQMRTTLIFDLKVAMSEPIASSKPSVSPTADPKHQQLVLEVERLRRAELRLAHIAGTVVETFQAITVPSPPPRTYGKSGRLQG